jgi:hypothetical protein
VQTGLVHLTGGWSAYYGPRIWDSEAVATIVGLFFPPSSGAAAAKLEDELNKQLNALEAAIDTALADT